MLKVDGWHRSCTFRLSTCALILAILSKNSFLLAARALASAFTVQSSAVLSDCSLQRQHEHPALAPITPV